MAPNPFMTIKRDRKGALRIRGTDANTSAAEDTLNSVPLLTDEEAMAMLFQAERDDLPEYDPEYDPDGDEP